MLTLCHVSFVSYWTTECTLCSHCTPGLSVCCHRLTSKHAAAGKSRHASCKSTKFHLAIQQSQASDKPQTSVDVINTPQSCLILYYVLYKRLYKNILSVDTHTCEGYSLGKIKVYMEKINWCKCACVPCMLAIITVIHQVDSGSFYNNNKSLKGLERQTTFCLWN